MEQIHREKQLFVMFLNRSRIMIQFILLKEKLLDRLISRPFHLIFRMVKMHDFKEVHGA